MDETPKQIPRCPSPSTSSSPFSHCPPFSLVVTDFQAGYREGITDGKLSTLQQGFDEGFALSAPLARHLGILRGRATALLQFYIAQSAPSELVDGVRDLLRDLGRARRDDVLPKDLEREAHEEEDRLARGEEGFELESNDKRDMEHLEKALEGVSSGMSRTLNGPGEGQEQNGESLLESLEMRLVELEGRALRR